MAAPLRIFVSGMIAADPHAGGATWATLQYVLGLRRLGHNVTFVESIPVAKTQPTNASFEESTNAQYFKDVSRRFGFEGNAALVMSDGTSRSIGLRYEDLRA